MTNKELINKLDDEYKLSLKNMPVHERTVIELIVKYQDTNENILDAIIEYDEVHDDFDLDVFIDKLSLNQYSNIRNLLKANLKKWNFCKDDEVSFQWC